VPALLQEITNTVPLQAGGVCLVDPAFMLAPSFSQNAHPQSRGLTPAHEIGHALGPLLIAGPATWLITCFADICS
jgi:hypothetical protein